MTTIDPSRVTDAVVTLTRTVLEDGLGILVGDGKAPRSPEGSDVLELVQPYVVVYQVPLGNSFVNDGFTGVGGMGWLRYQFTVVGLQRDQVERTASMAQRIFTDRTSGGVAPYSNALNPTGHVVLERRPAGFVPLDGSGPKYSGGALVDLRVQVS